MICVYTIAKSKYFESNRRKFWTISCPGHMLRRPLVKDRVFAACLEEGGSNVSVTDASLRSPALLLLFGGPHRKLEEPSQGHKHPGGRSTCG
jgi:hypothetical protein